MKKLQLKALTLNAKEILTREEMKKVMGASGGSAGSGNRCNYSCTSDDNCDSVCPNCETASWRDTKYCFK